MFGLFKSSRDKKRKEQQEMELKEALAQKMKKFDEKELTGQTDDRTEYTLVEIGGRVVKAIKEHITIFDVGGNGGKKK